jgi:hypothetical protein
MNRRSFFKFLPVAPVVFAAEGARAAIANEAPHDHAMSLIINGSKKREPGEVMHVGKDVTLNWPKDDPSKNVAMAVGEDGRMWFRSHGGEWKRVVLE